MTLVPEVLRFLKDYYMMVYAAGIVVVMIFMPGGIAGLVRSLTVSQRLRAWWQSGTTATQQVAATAAASDSGAFLKTLTTETRRGNGTLLRVKGLAKHFGGLKAVDGVDMEIRRGEIHALIGPNGSGKTTIINMLSGLYVPTAGEIELDGTPITGQRPHDITAQGMARTFQNIRLFGDLTVLDNVMIGQHSRTNAGAGVQRPPAGLPAGGRGRDAAEGPGGTGVRRLRGQGVRRGQEPAVRAAACAGAGAGARLRPEAAAAGRAGGRAERRRDRGRSWSCFSRSATTGSRFSWSNTT